MWSTTEAEKNEICRAISAIQAPRVLEIGAFRGETTRALAEAASERGGYVAVIDPMRWAAELVANGITRHLPSALSRLSESVTVLLGDASYEEEFWSNVGALKSHVRLHRAWSSAPELIAADEPDLAELDIVFIDGDHSYEGAGGDLWHWGRRVAPGGTIFIHDATTSFPGVLAALAEFGRAHDVRVEYPVDGSLAVIRVRHSLLAAERRVA